MAYITIVGMAVVTYFTRVGGLWLLNRCTITPRLEAWLKALPGTIVVSIIAPTVLTSGWAEGSASLLTAVVALISRSFIIAMVTGVASVWLLRGFLG